MKAVSRIAFENRIGLPICATDCWIASPIERSLAPRSSMMRSRFSATTTAESTMMPKSIAPIEIRFAGMPVRSSSRKAPSSDSGTTEATISAERQLPSPRKSTSTSSTRPMPSPMFLRTVSSVRSISSVRS